MNAIVVLILAAIGIGVGYGIYAKSIDRRVIQPDPLQGHARQDVYGRRRLHPPPP